MEIKEKKEVIERVVNVYIAKDGKEFSCKADCEWYEMQLDRQEARKKIEKFIIKDMDDCFPINTDNVFSDLSSYHWYLIKCEDDFQLLQKAYADNLTVPNNYPEVICVEESGCDYYDYHMNNMFETTKSFWEKLGYEVSFKKVGDK